MRRSIYTAVCIFVLATTACEHKELCYDHPHTTQVDVVFDWNYAPDAEQNNEVESMCLWFYPVDERGNRTSEPIYQSLSGMKGGKVDIPVGRYQVLYYNNDYERVQFRGTDWFFTHECYTREGSLFEPVYGNAVAYSAPRADGTEQEPVVITPDKMWGDNAMNVEITENGLSYWFIRDGETEITTISNPDNTFKLMPHEQVCDYTFEVRNVENLKYATQVSAAISGMSGSVFCAEEELDDECVTLPLEAASDGISTITGAFHTFGHHDLNDERHILTVYAWMQDGRGVYGSVDVTDQVDKAKDKRNVHIEIDGFKLPKPITNGGGFHPDIDDWERVDVEIDM